MARRKKAPAWRPKVGDRLRIPANHYQGHGGEIGTVTTVWSDGFTWLAVENPPSEHFRVYLWPEPEMLVQP